MKLPELIGAIEKMEDLVRRYCGRRDAQGNAHSLAKDTRMSSLEALPDDLEKHVQLNRARLTFRVLGVVGVLVFFVFFGCGEGQRQGFLGREWGWRIREEGWFCGWRGGGDRGKRGSFF